MEIRENGYGNKDQTIKTDVATFMVIQRNAGYVENDGRWIVSQLPELYWYAGTLRQRRPGKFLGAFDTPTDALAAIASATPVDILDKAVS